MEAYIECNSDADFVDDDLIYQDFPLTESLGDVGRIKSHEARVSHTQAV